MNIEKEDLRELVAGLSANGCADVVLECSGAAPAVDAGLNLIKKRGYFVQIGLPGKKITFDLEKVCYKELHFSGSLGSRNHSWRKALQLLREGKVDLEPLADTIMPLSQWQEAFRKFENKEGCKILFDPTLE